MSSTRRLEFLVPLADNDGQQFPDGAFRDFERFLIDLAGGFTRRGTVEGAWKSPSGIVYRDSSRWYSIVSPARRAARLAATIEAFVKDRFRQEAVLIESLPTFSSAF